MKKERDIFYFLLSIIVCLIDQVAKWVVQFKMTPFQSIPILGRWVSLTYVRNEGAAFGILESQRFLLILIALAVFLYVWFQRRAIKKYPPIFQIGLTISLGGALGNLIDRIRLGYVIDFLDFHLWPVFNIADIAIVLGVLLIMYGLMKAAPTQESSVTSVNGSGAEEENG